VSIGPLDTTSIIERLRLQVPELKLVGGAADQAEAVSGSPLMPCAFVVLAAEDLKSENMTGLLLTSARAQIHVIYGVRHYQGGQRGKSHAEAGTPLVNKGRIALNGWKPTAPDSTKIESIQSNGRGQLIKLADTEWWWLDPFTCTYRGRTA
jgi:hypothetical protein